LSSTQPRAWCICLPVPSTKADATEAFHCERLDFQREFNVPPSETKRDPATWEFLAGAVLYLSWHAGDGVIRGAVYFISDNVDALHAEFVASNVPIHIVSVDQPWGMRELYVLDPDGNSVRFGAAVGR
jgi:hypothetical protein